MTTENGDTPFKRGRAAGLAEAAAYADKMSEQSDKPRLKEQLAKFADLVRGLI